MILHLCAKGVLGSLIFVNIDIHLIFLPQWNSPLIKISTDTIRYIHKSWVDNNG